MERLRELIAAEGAVLPGGLLKVDGFLNHRLLPDLTLEMGRAFRDGFERLGMAAPDRIVTAEVSGIAPALGAGVAYGVPVVYARKTRARTMGADAFEATAPSPTKGGTVSLLIAREYLAPGDRVLLIDDFLASGRTVLALAELIERAGAHLLGTGFVIEKSFQGGRERLAPLNVPLLSLAVIDSLADGRITLAP